MNPVTSVFKTVEPSQSESRSPDVKPVDKVTIGLIKEKGDPTIDDYKKENPFPYVSKVLKMETPYDYLPPDVKTKLSDIDKYITREVDTRRMSPTISSYEKILAELEFEMSEGQGLDMSEKIDRFGNFARNANKLDGVDDIKENLVKRLMRMRRSREMDNLVLREIGKRIF